MKGNRLGEDFIIALQEFIHDVGVKYAIIGSCVCQGFGLKQKGFHVRGPRFFLDHDQCLEFTKMMRIAQSMLDAFDCEIRAPVIVHNKPADPRQEIAPAGRDPEVAQKR